jgi:GNAT superfamily N-acetyltransferase
VITIDVEPLASPDARRLIDALNCDISARYPNPEDNFFELDETEVADGRGAFVIAREDGAAIGCGAVRRIDEQTAEVKRMYVAPAARGKRLGAKILAELEVQARKLGITRLVLETGERQPEAIALYEREGFRRIPKFGEYIDAPLSVCFGKDL